MLFEGTPLFEYARRLVSFKGREPSIFKDVFNRRDVKELIIYLNTEDQIIAEGVDTEGNIIGVYSPATELITNGRKKAGEPFDLYDTGAFIESFRVDVDSGEFTITSNPIKVDPVEGPVNIYDKFNNFKIEGLTDENMRVLIDYVRNYYIDDYKARFIR